MTVNMTRYHTHEHLVICQKRLWRGNEDTNSLTKKGGLSWIIWLGLISLHKPFKSEEVSLASSRREVRGLKHEGDLIWCTTADFEDVGTMC